MRIFPQTHLQTLPMAVVPLRLVSICELKTIYWAVWWCSTRDRATQQKYKTLIFKECFNFMLLLYLRRTPKLFWFAKFVFSPKDHPLKYSIKKIMGLFLSQQLFHFNINILSKVWCSSWFYIPENADLPETNRELYAASRSISNSSDYLFLDMSIKILEVTKFIQVDVVHWQ